MRYRNAIAAAALSILIFLTPSSSDVHAEGIENISPTAETVSIHLRIESSTTTLFSGDIDVDSCATNASSTPSLSGYCAIRQSSLENAWNSYGDAVFLESIQGASNDYVNGYYWNWFSNLEYGQTSLDQHILNGGEYLLVVVGKMPLKIEVSTTTPQFGSTTTVSVSEFAFDESWNGVWVPAASSSVLVLDEWIDAGDDGILDIAVSTSSPFSIKAAKIGFIGTSELSIFPQAFIEQASSTESATTTPDEAQNNPPVTGSGPRACSIDISSAKNFLLASQASDGSFGSSINTDWAAIALSAINADFDNGKILSRISGQTSTLSNATDYERRAMALMALGANPYSTFNFDYIRAITERFDGTQIGDASLVNDDIFALFPLIKAGYSQNDPIIEKIAAHIISRQEADGSWEGSIDMTAAAIQSLSLVSSLQSSGSSIAKARGFLASKQNEDGGFGSTFSTSWAIQAIAALGESQSMWSKGGRTPLDSLCLSQNTDGGFEDPSLNSDTRVWATAYAIPAALNKTWSAIMPAFARVEPAIQSVSSGGGGSISREQSTTSPILASTTYPAETIMIAYDWPIESAPFQDDTLPARETYALVSEAHASTSEVALKEDAIGQIAGAGESGTAISGSWVIYLLSIFGILSAGVLLWPDKK